MSAFFSLIIPTYNRAWALAKNIPKIIAQENCPTWELLIVDDGSTDETKFLIEKMQKIDSRIRYFLKENGGAASARQFGLQCATGEWIAYVDSDDELFPNYLHTAATFFADNPRVYFAMANMERQIVLHDKNHEVVAAYDEPATDKDPATVTLQDYAHWKIKPCGTGIFHRRDILTPDIVWDASFILLEDIDFLLQLGAHYPEHFGFIPEKIFYLPQLYGVGGVCSKASYSEWADYFEKFYLKHKNDPAMSGQEWYPKKVLSYREKQRQFEAGAIPSPAVRYFPEYFYSKATAL